MQPPATSPQQGKEKGVLDKKKINIFNLPIHRQAGFDVISSDSFDFL